MSLSSEMSSLETLWDAFPAEMRREYLALLEQQASGGAKKAKEACRRIAGELATRKVTPRLALRLHLAAIEEVIGGKGPLFAKQVLTCGDVLVLELMSALAEAYRGESPGLESPGPGAPHSRRRTAYVSG